MHCPMLQSFTKIMVKRSCILPVNTEANTINTAKQRREYISLFTQFLLSKKSVSVKPKAIWNIFKFFTSFQIAKGNKYFRQTPINLTSHSKIKVCSGSSYIQALATKETDFIFYSIKQCCQFYQFRNEIAKSGTQFWRFEMVKVGNTDILWI